MRNSDHVDVAYKTVSAQIEATTTETSMATHSEVPDDSSSSDKSLSEVSYII